MPGWRQAKNPCLPVRNQRHILSPISHTYSYFQSNQCVILSYQHLRSVESKEQFPIKQDRPWINHANFCSWQILFYVFVQGESITKGSFIFHRVSSIPNTSAFFCQLISMFNTLFRQLLPSKVYRLPIYSSSKKCRPPSTVKIYRLEQKIPKIICACGWLAIKVCKLNSVSRSISPARKRN